MTKSWLTLLAVPLLACSDVEFDDDATVEAAAYAALIDSLTGPTGYPAIEGARVTLLTERVYEIMPAAPKSVIDAMIAKGIPVVPREAVICPGEYRLAIGRAQREVERVYLIDVDVVSMSPYGFGDIEIFQYRVDCRSSACAAVYSAYLDQAEIGGSRHCGEGG